MCPHSATPPTATPTHTSLSTPVPGEILHLPGLVGCEPPAPSRAPPFVCVCDQMKPPEPRLPSTPFPSPSSDPATSNQPTAAHPLPSGGQAGGISLTLGPIILGLFNCGDKGREEKQGETLGKGWGSPPGCQGSGRTPVLIATNFPPPRPQAARWEKCWDSPYQGRVRDQI